VPARIAGNIASLALAVVLLAVPGTVTAATALRGTMRAWRSERRNADAMLAGRIAINPVTLAGTLRNYASDAGRIAESVNVNGARAADFRAHFVAFRNDAQTAQTDIGQRSRLEADLRRVFSDCQSCHDKYKD
jgi:hypothetical protein